MSCQSEPTQQKGTDMSTTETVETVEATETETVETVKSTGDPMRDAIIQSIVALTEESNAKVAEIAAHTTDVTKVVHDYLTDPNSTDEKITKFQAWKEALLAKLEEEESKAYEYAKEKVAAAQSDDFDVEAAKKSQKELADKVKTAKKFYLTTLPGTSEDDLKGVPDLKTLRGGTAGGGTGSKRPRVNSISIREAGTENWTEVSKPGKNSKGEDVTVTNFTVLAQTLAKAGGAKVEPKDLQAAAFEAAGTDDLNSLEGKVFEFGYTVGEKNYEVKIQPKTADAE